MNRAIKFRWYDKKINRIYNSETVIYSDGSIWNNYDSDHNILAGQFIGIQDKNNQDIYEDDIVGRIEKSCDGIKTMSIYKVVFKNHSFCLEVLKSAILKTGAIVNFLEELNVIGNVYENPELLAE